jgi:hypothetical protein
MRKLFSAAAVVALVAVLGVSTADASVYEGTVELTCTTVTAAGTGAHILDRDNTGSGQEALRIDVVDGNGTPIYTLSFQNTLGTFAAGMLGTTLYTTAPEANPITFTLTSLAGNGLPEQVDVTSVGACDTIPWAAPTAAAPPSGVQGETVTVTGSGCPAGVVSAQLDHLDGDLLTMVATGTDEVTGPEDGFSIDLVIPADAPAGDALITVTCGPADDPSSDATVLPFSIVAAETPTTPSTAAPTTTAAATQPTATSPRFTG